MSQYGHIVGKAFKESKHMAPVGQGRNPLVGFAMGFLLGPLGVGLVLKSPADFFITLTLVILGSLATVGVAAPVLWCLCGAWAYVRIRNSQEAEASAISSATLNAKEPH